MKSIDFWLNLHRLAESLHAEGLTPEERADNVVSQFDALAPIARRELLLDLNYLSMHLTDLRVILTARVKAEERAARPAKEPCVA